jgi:hypothetical protein
MSTKNRYNRYASLTEFVSSLTFKRTVNREKSFDDEPCKPPLGNLATHMHVVKCKGNPWVFSAVPAKTRTCATGTGFFMGQFFCTHTQPVPVPVTGNPQVCNKIVMPFQNK